MGRNRTQIRFDDGIYYNDKGQKVIVDRLTHTVYTITKNDEKKYNFFRGRYAIVLALTMFTCAFINLPLGIIVLLVTAIVAEASYRLWFLPSLHIDDNAQIPSKPSIIQKYARDNDGTLILMMVCSLALVILLILYCVQNINDFKAALMLKTVNDSIIIYGSIFLCGLAAYVFYVSLMVFIERKRKKK